MKAKIYTIMNTRSEQITSIWMAKNDKEAGYLYAINMQKQKQENPFFVESDFKLTALGVIYTDEEDRDEGVGIDYLLAKDFPYSIDEIEYNFEPKHNSPSSDNITVYDKKEQEKIKRDIQEAMSKDE